MLLFHDPELPPVPGQHRRSRANSGRFAKQGWKDGRWHPVVTPPASGDAGGQYQYNGDQAIDPASGASTLADYHKKLRDVSATDINVGFVFKPLAHFFHLEGDRKKAQRIVFEGSVVKPVVESSRSRMVAPSPARPSRA